MSLINMRHGLMAGMRLPYDAEVEYLESTGTQWIDTNLVHTVQKYEYYIDFTPSTDGNATAPFGSSKQSCWDGIFWLGTVVYIGNSSISGDEVWRRRGVRETIRLSVDNQHVIIEKDGVKKLDKTFSGSIISGFNILLFGYTFGSSRATGLSSQRVHRFVVAQDSVVRFDGIPVRFTNELGQTEGAMFDRANPTVGMNPDGSARTDGLYRNRGTGAFIIGPGASAANGGGYKLRCTRRSYRRSLRPSARFWQPRLWKEVA